MNKITKIVTVLALAGMPVSPISFESAPNMPSLEPVVIVEVETPEPETPVVSVTTVTSAPANTGNGAAPYLHEQRQTDVMGTSECAFAMGCVNLSEDEEWLNSMKALARQLFEKGMLQLFPAFQRYF